MPKPVYVCQFPDASQVEDRIARRNEEDLNLPEWNQCGICCVRMIALGLERNPPPLEEMYRTAFDQYGVFRMVDDKVVGAYHRELAGYVHDVFGLNTEAVRRQSVEDVAQAILDGWYVIASVSAEIRDASVLEPLRRNGHLVLVFDVGERDGAAGFLLHNSSGFSSTETQEDVFVSLDRFRQFFSGNSVNIRSDQK